MAGFEDGVVRLLELYDPRRLHVVTGLSHRGDAKLRLKQTFKPHNAPVTAVAYDRNGEILATGVRGFPGNSLSLTSKFIPCTKLVLRYLLYN